MSRALENVKPSPRALCQSTMMRLGWTSSLCAMALVCAAAAQERESRSYVVTDVPSAHDQCDRSAPRIDLASLIVDPTPYLGRCIRAEGIVSGGLLFTDVDALYLAAQRTWDLDDPPAYRHVGTYPQTATSVLGGRIARTEVIAIVRTCSELGGPDVMMVLGYCHHYSGPFLQVARIARRSGAITRRVGEAERVRIGTLGFAPPDWEDRAAVEAVAMQWLRSIQAGDLATFARLAGHDELDVTDRDSYEHYVFEARHSAFAQFRGSNVTPQFAMFIYKPPGALAATMEEATTYREAEACFCRIQDCTGRWPISSGDSGNHERRPYICTNIFDASGDDDSERLWVLRTGIDNELMREPE